VVRSKARVAGATEWLDTVDDLVTALEDEWSFESGSVFSDATEALVIGATLDDGTEAVLKVHIPRRTNIGGLFDQHQRFPGLLPLDI
jgi:hypothetical protein